MSSIYNEHSPATSIGRGVLASASWGRFRGGYAMRRWRTASATASVRLATPSLERIWLTWVLMVDGLTTSLPAICVLFNPSIIKASTARSRSVRSWPGAGGWLAAFTSAWVASGERVARPECAARMARASSSADTSLSK